MKLVIAVLIIILFSYPIAGSTDVYLTPLDLSGGTDITHVRVDTTGLVNGLNMYVKYDPSCAAIIDVEINDTDWWLPWEPTYREGKVYFSAMRWGNSTGDFNVANMTVVCVGDPECETSLNFTEPGICGHDLGDVDWTNESVTCPNGCAYDVCCYSCDDCEQKINNASLGDVVTLMNDISSVDNGIMFINTVGVTFDGNGHTITGSYNYMGIDLNQNSHNNIIKNVVVERFRHGIYLYCGDNNIVENSTVKNCLSDGISVLYGSGSIIRDCTLDENRGYDFSFNAASVTNCNTTVINVTGSGGRPIALYNTQVDLHDREFSGLFLAGADGSTINNVTVAGSDIYKNNGIKTFYSDDVTFNGVNSSGNCWGLYAFDSPSMRFDRVNCIDNSQTGIHLYHSPNCTINDTETTFNGQCGMYISHSPNTTITNGYTGYNSFAGIYLDTGGDNDVHSMHIIRNRDPGILTARSSGNLIYDNNFYDNDYPDNRWQVSVSDSNANTWNVTKRFGKNIIGGDVIGGNCWYGLEPIDVNGDGIGDEPYVINGVSDANVDYLTIAYPPCTGICGDVDCNGRVSANDVVETYHRAVDPEYPLVSEWAADVDDNTYVSANDVVEIYRKAVDPEHVLNCAC